MSFRRLFRWALLVGGWVGGTVLGLAGAALGTDAGRAVLVRAGLSYANQAVDGRVTVDSFDGSLLGGLELRGVRVVDSAGAVLFDAARLGVRYRVSDFLSRRVVLGQVTLDSPLVRLRRAHGGRWNLEDVFRLGRGAGADDAGGRVPLVAFRDVTVIGGLVDIVDGDAVRTVELARVRASYLRLSSPFAGESAIRFDLARAQVRVSEPALDIRDAAGRVDVDGDSITLALSTLRLPNTVTSVRGVLHPTDPLTFDLAFGAERFAATDVRVFVASLPVGIAGSGAARVSVDARGVTRFVGTGLDLVTANAGRLTGRLGFVIGPGDRWATDRIDVTTTALDLDYVRSFLDTLPFAGRLSGRTVADGPPAALTLDLDWRFADARAAGAETVLRGSGEVSLGPPDGAVLGAFRVAGARVALATVRALVPGVALRGTLELEGTLDGPWENAVFDGALRHRDDTLPATVARGTVRLDGRGDTTGVFADLRVDSLQADGLRPSYPAIALAGAYGGRVIVGGYFDALAVTLDLSGPNGVLTGGATAVLLNGHQGARDIDLRFADFTLQPIRARLPRTRLAGAVQGAVEIDSGMPPVVDVAVRLDRSVVGNVDVDSARVRLRQRDSLLVADTLRAWAHGATVTGHGALGLAAPRHDTLRLEVRVDSLGAVIPLLVRLAGGDPAALRGDTVRGAVRGTFDVTGAFDRLAIGGEIGGRNVRWNQTVVPVLRARGAWDAGERGLVLRLDADTVVRGTQGFAGVEATLDGRSDSLGWRVRARLGQDGAFLAGGRYGGDSAARVVAFDSLAVLLARDVWFVDRGASVTVTDSMIAFTGVTFATASGGSRVALVGGLPRLGPGRLDVEMAGLRIDNLWALAQLDVARAGGEVSGTLHLGGTARAPAFEGAINIRNAMFNEFRAPLTRGTVTYRDRRLDGSFTLWQAGEEILNVRVDLPLDLALRDAQPNRQLPGPLTVRAQAEGVDLSFISAIYPGVRQTSGRFWADLGVTGAWDRPQLTGFLRVEDGAASLPALGVRHERLNGSVRLSGDTIRVERLSLASAGGTADLTGYVRLEGLTRPRLDLRIRANEFRAVDIPDFLTLTMSSDVQLTGPVFGATLTGEGTVTRGVVYFADIIEKNIVSLEDSLLDSATVALIRRQGLGTAVQNRILDSLHIDNLRLTMGSDVRLRSGEANIQLAGQVTLAKAGARYRIDGTLETPRGVYSLPLGPVTKDFTVTRGEVRYFGTPDLDAALDIDARNQVRTVRGEVVSVFVHVGGTINAPTLTLSSDVRPPLSDTEIISYLAFGAPSAQAAGGQLEQSIEQSLATIAGRITGQLGGTLISDLGLPLDYFEVRPSLSGGLGGEISAGKQLSERVFLSVTSSKCPSQTITWQALGGGLEYRVSRQWRLSLSVNPVVTCFTTAPSAYQVGVDALWERSY